MEFSGFVTQSNSTNILTSRCISRPHSARAFTTTHLNSSSMTSTEPNPVTQSPQSSQSPHPTPAIYEKVKLPQYVPTPFASLQYSPIPHHHTIQKHIIHPGDLKSPAFGKKTRILYRNLAISDSDAILDNNVLQKRTIKLCTNSTKVSPWVEVCLLSMKPREESIFRIDVEQYMLETGIKIPPLCVSDPETGKMHEQHIRTVYQWIKIEDVPELYRLDPRTFLEALEQSESDLERAAELFAEGSKLFASQYTGEKKLPHFEQAFKLYKDILITLETCPHNAEPDEALRTQMSQHYDDIYFRASKNAVAAAIMKWRVTKQMVQYLDENGIDNVCKPKVSLGAAKDMANRITTIKGGKCWGWLLLARVYRLMDKAREAHESLCMCRELQTGEHIWGDKLKQEILKEEKLVNAALKKENDNFLGGKRTLKLGGKMMAAMSGM